MLPIPAGELMPPILEITRRGRIFMNTYEECNTILTIALLIVAILNLKINKLPVILADRQLI